MIVQLRNDPRCTGIPVKFYSLTSSFHLSIDPNQAAITLAKLQNPVKASFESINDSVKETHSGLNKYTKSLDKVITQVLPHGFE